MARKPLIKFSLSRCASNRKDTGAALQVKCYFTNSNLVSQHLISREPSKINMPRLKTPILFVSSLDFWHPLQKHRAPKGLMLQTDKPMAPRQLKTSLLLVSSWDFWHPLNKQGTKDLMSRNRQIPLNMETVKTALYVCTLHETFDTQYNIFMSVLHLVKTM
jgi:hypothetical protein